MGLCIVDCCDASTQDVSYFEFPTSRNQRKKWQDAVRLPCKVPLGAVVCSRHFRPDEYEPIRGRVRLKGKVVPTLLLEKSENTNTQEKNQIEPDQKKQNSHDLENDQKETENDENIKEINEINSESNKNCEKDVHNIPETKKDETKDRRKGNRQNGRKKDMENDICRVINKEDNDEEKKCVDSDPNDIEDMITNYQIKNKLPNPALLPEPSIEPTTDSLDLLPGPGNEPDVPYVQETEPVFIEVSVDKNGNNPTASGAADCLMLLESVQVDIDPASLMLPELDSDVESVHSVDRKNDPISLLTSSDDDEVIIEEPHIDTVEVSDETDEDDVPLVKLVKKPTKKKNLKKKKDIKNIKYKFDFKDMSVFDYYCVQCRFSTSSAFAYTQHLEEHSTVIQICQICNYTTASKTQFSRHSRKHKEEKKFRCHLCEYKARHKMSLVYHLESHSTNKSKSVIPIIDADKVKKCKKCVKYKCVCKKKKYSCDDCSYKTERRSDMRRHIDRKHTDVLE